MTATDARTTRTSHARTRLLHDLRRLSLEAGRGAMEPDSRVRIGPPPEAMGAMDAAALRRRVAGELHDGILQVLTAIAVRLDAAEMVLESRPDDARRLISEICRTVRAEQRELRMFVDELKGTAFETVAGRVQMRDRLLAMLERVETLWGVSCDLDATGHLPSGTDVGRTVLRLVQEAAVNAIRHGNPTRVSTRIRVSGDRLRIVVADDGSGIRGRPRLDGTRLVPSSIGPILLERRVADAGGRLRVVTGVGGTRLFIRLPTHPPDRSGAH